MDGFGRPFEYRISGSWKFESWTLISRGFDTAAKADDMCIAGSTKLARLAESVGKFASLIKVISSGSANVSDQLAGIRMLKCPNSLP